MAGETIFIQPILKETIEGMDESLSHMSESIETLMGTDEKSTLHDVVNELGVVVGGLTGVISKLAENQAATAALLDGVSAKLDGQIAELQQVVTATTNNVPMVRVKPGDTVSAHEGLRFNFGANTTICNFMPYCTGIVKIKLVNYSNPYQGTLTIKDLDDIVIYSLGVGGSTIERINEFNLPVEAGRLLRFAVSGNASGYIRFEYIRFDYADVTEPDDIIEVTQF